MNSEQKKRQDEAMGQFPEMSNLLELGSQQNVPVFNVPVQISQSPVNMANYETPIFLNSQKLGVKPDLLNKFLNEASLSDQQRLKIKLLKKKNFKQKVKACNLKF